MTAFGKFEAVSLLRRHGRTSVWAARPARAPEDVADHCLKRVELTDREIAAGDPAAAEHLLIGAALQQAMAWRSVGWAAVQDLGTNGTDAYYVVERFPRSVQTLIDGDVRLTSTQLRTLLMGIVDALIELQVMYDRPHGNLKPSNVLLGHRIRPGTVCLTDPAATGQHVPSLTRAPDAKAIGRLLFAVVTRRPHTAAHWPLEFDDDWAALGASGHDWFDLCEGLIHPLGEAAPDLDDLMSRIAAIGPSWRRPRPSLLALLLVAALAWVGYLGRGPITDWCATAGRQVQAWVHPARPDHHGAHPRPLQSAPSADNVASAIPVTPPPGG